MSPRRPTALIGWEARPGAVCLGCLAGLVLHATTDGEEVVFSGEMWHLWMPRKEVVMSDQEKQSDRLRRYRITRGEKGENL